VKSAVAKIKRLSALRPRLALVLGSGFEHVVREMEMAAEIPYAQLPGFPLVGVPGHAGKLCLGRLAGVPILILSGRAHYYEGHSPETITRPIRILAEYGIRDLLLTNAAGGINRQLRAGSFMRVTDHINMMGFNPLRGPQPAGRQRFVDMTTAYDVRLGQWLQRAARLARITLHQGVYLAVSGPSFETPAEIRAFARLGADAVGMSTVPEVIVARQCGLNVAAVSCITNLAAGRSGTALSHTEVLETARRVRPQAALMLRKFAAIYGQNQEK